MSPDIPPLDHQPAEQDLADKGSAPAWDPAPFSSALPGRVAWYVDGFNLYHAVQALERPVLKWLDMHGLAASYLRGQQTLQAVNFFTALNS